MTLCRQWYIRPGARSNTLAVFERRGQDRRGQPYRKSKTPRRIGSRGQCRRWELNPHGRIAHCALNAARLPVPPLRPTASSGTYYFTGNARLVKDRRCGVVNHEAGARPSLECQAPFQDHDRPTYRPPPRLSPQGFAWPNVWATQALSREPAGFSPRRASTSGGSYPGIGHATLPAPRRGRFPPPHPLKPDSNHLQPSPAKSVLTANRSRYPQCPGRCILTMRTGARRSFPASPSTAAASCS